MAVAWPALQRSKPTRMELSFFLRSAWPGCSSISTTSEAWWMRTSCTPAPWRRSSSRTRGSSPTRTTSKPRSRCARRAPSTVAAGARSPPIASRAMVMRPPRRGPPSSYSSLPFMTARPWYSPHLGQARWDSTGSPHFGHAPTFGAVAFRCARRWPRSCRLVRFLGTPISLLLLLELDGLERRPAGVECRLLATAVGRVQVLAARGAQALAQFVAQWRGRHREEDLLVQRGRQVDGLAAVGLLVYCLCVEGVG